MQWMMRPVGHKVAALLGALILLGAPGAFAVSIPDDVYTLPVDPTLDSMTVDLGAPPPFAGFPEWLRLRPNDPTDTLTDYEAYISNVSTVATPGNKPRVGDAWTYDITFAVTWLGTIDEATPPGAVAEQMLFVILDSRFETQEVGVTFDTTYDLTDSGFVRASAGGVFEVNGAPYGAPEIVRDDTLGPMGQGFVNDQYPDDWIGIYLDAIPGVTQTVTMRWALGEEPDMSTGGDDVFFPNALFVATVPEPGAAALMGVGMLILGLTRRGRRSSA